MLKSLNIKNYAIIDELNIDFSKGFNVFTGETGAGKSIIVGALSFLVKGKADTSVIRNGRDKAIIEGVFDVDEYMKPILDDADIEYDDELIIRRVISSDNRNSIKINQCSVTLGFLTDLLANHIDIHSQKDSQYLLNKHNHITLLDKFCANNNYLNDYKQKFDEYKAALNEYNELLNNTYNESEIEYIKFDLQELLDASLDIEEEEDLSEKERRYKSAEKYITSLSMAINYFDDDNGIKENLNSLIKQLNIDDQEIENTRNNIETIYYNLNDEIDSLKKVLSSFSENDLNIEQIEERLYLYSKLKRKHNTDTQGLLQLIDEYKEQLRFFEDKDNVLNEKKKQVDELYAQSFNLAQNLHENRIKMARQLEENVINNCNDLMLKNVEFKVQINEVELNTLGIDDVEFYISLNKGESLKPLKDIASGGEISRIMLALKSVFTSLSEMSLVIFDEIDTGVSGKVSLSMGKKIKYISNSSQVLCITHLAPVAACANSHYYIYKKDNNIYTSTQIKKLNKDEIINELASISTTDTSVNALKAAQELYTLAQGE